MQAEGSLGIAWQSLGEHERAAEALRAAIGVSEALGDTRSAAATLLLSRVCFEPGAHRRVRLSRSAAALLSSLGLSYSASTGDMGRCGEMWGDMGLSYSASTGDMGRCGEMWGDMGLSYSASGDARATPLLVNPSISHQSITPLIRRAVTHASTPPSPNKRTNQSTRI